MARTGFFHHIGTFLLFAASILVLITTISSPVINDISLLKVTLTNQSSARNTSVTFGTFGFCLLDVAPAETDQDMCTGKHIGYNPLDVMANIDGVDFSTASEDTSKALTRVMVLHPIVCGLAFIAFLMAIGSGICGALLASLTSALAWVLSVVVLATDFTLFGIVRDHVNNTKDDQSGSHAKFGVAIWTLLAAMICLFFATFIVLFTCFSARRHRHDNVATKEAGFANGTTTTTKRRFWQRRNRY